MNQSSVSRTAHPPLKWENYLTLMVYLTAEGNLKFPFIHKVITKKFVTFSRVSHIAKYIICISIM